MNDLLRYIKKIGMRLVLSPMNILPVKQNRVMLIDEVGYTYACNPKAISEYLLQHYKDEFQIVFSVRDVKKQSGLKGKNVIFIKFNSFKYFYYALTSNVIVTNSGGLSYVPIKKKQYVINTHHGGGAYKTAGIDMFEDSFFFRKDMLLSAKQTKCFLSTNRIFTEKISKACLIPKERFWEIGMPRNDRLFSPDIKRMESIRTKIGVIGGQKIVLFAPTYRKPKDNYYKGSIAIQYNIDKNMVCDSLKARFGGEWVFAYRLHPCVENKSDYIVDGALDLSSYDDMQDLLEIADVLISDFSSSLWDYMLTGKPCFMYAPDIEHYIATTKVYTPIDEWPFPKAHTNTELKECILTFDEDKYGKDIRKHYEDLGGCESGMATQLVCERIKEVCT